MKEEKKIITFEKCKQNIPEWKKELYFGRLFGFHDISSFFENNDPLGTVVENINKFIYSVQEKTYPDLIVMMAPDSMIQYNSIVPNGYGIKTYMLCQAVCPDYCFCCVPEDLGVPEMLNALSEDFKGRYGVEILDNLLEG